MVGKIATRSITRSGELLYTIQIPKGKDGKETEERLALVSKEQIATLQLLGEKIPAVGTEVSCEASVNPTSGIVSEKWVKFL